MKELQLLGKSIHTHPRTHGHERIKTICVRTIRVCFMRPGDDRQPTPMLLALIYFNKSKTVK